ncbi:MAG: NAD-dependent epimerase/dehydratase family protein, partial [Firmicutes bacterium]|nr:NAD-dependent epimerase/dehydratase family protein [Bacillota bacterium]
MRLLVTGGAGFIGSNFIRYIIKKYPQYKVINLDKLTYAGNLDNLKDIENNSNYTFVKGDICDRKIVDELSKDVEAIVNFAAQSHVDRSIINASGFIKTNIDGTYNLLEAAKRYNISRFVQISTDECYGSIEKGSFKETNSLRPSSPYAASKAAADMAVHSYRITFNLPTIVARSSNNFGPYS